MHELHVVNPPKRRGGHRRRGKGGRFIKGHASGGSKKRRHNPARRSRRRRHNPGALALGGLTKRFPVEAILWGVGGAVGTELGGAAAARLLPASLQVSTPAKLAVKAGVIVAGGFLARRFVGGSAARALMIGGGIALGVELVRDYILPSFPQAAALMSDYSFPGMADYSIRKPSLLAGAGRAIDAGMAGSEGRWPSTWQ